ncbi:MAG TPA: helix-turn-helix domain-containing protein [Solirubrobacteraceae bacterium]|nr:helix-turn-helix domain-containing protein [Solirubrobacteraceae bacterium]
MSTLSAALLAELSEQDLDRLAELLAPRLAKVATAEAPTWLDVGQAAEHVRCPKSRIYSLVSAKRIPHHRDGSRLLFRRAELDRWVQAGGGKRT